MNHEEIENKISNGTLTFNEAMTHLMLLLFENQYLSKPDTPVHTNIILSELIMRMGFALCPEPDKPKR